MRMMLHEWISYKGENKFKLTTHKTYMQLFKYFLTSLNQFKS